MLRKLLLTLLLPAALFALTACSDYGQVIQGRTVAFKEEGGVKTVTFIKDSGIDDKNPHYTELPAVGFTLPTDPAETGQLPKVGLRMKIDLEKKILTMYNPEKGAFEELPFELVQNDTGVNPEHPLVQGKKFPAVNEAEHTVTIFSRRQGTLSVIKLAEADFSRYKEADWDAGDEVRIYYKEMGKSLRFMNVTRTDLTKSK